MLPVPMFWALYDQLGSRWIIQALAMDGRVTDSFRILPDQMQTFNSILILAFIPLFQIVIYPLVEKLGVRTTWVSNWKYVPQAAPSNDHRWTPRRALLCRFRIRAAFRQRGFCYNCSC